MEVQKHSTLVSRMTMTDTFFRFTGTVYERCDS
jgi:hypothetical protein